MTNFLLTLILATLLLGFYSLNDQFNLMTNTFQACLEIAKEDKP